MTAPADADAPLLEWADAGSALEGVSGDASLVHPFPGGALVAVLDGLGHGAEAAAASRKAVRVLSAHAQEPVDSLFTRCHEALRGTRGAVMSVASLDARGSTMTWAGVGNVEAVLLRGGGALPITRDVLTPRGGVVGYVLSTVRLSAVPIVAGDTLVLATDGIRSDFTAGIDLRLSPRQLADLILARHARGADDALVLVARYRAGA